MDSRTYIVAGVKPWNRRVFDDVIVKYPGQWHFAGSREELTKDWIAEINPRYVFFLHWPWKVVSEVFRKYDSVCFHMTDVPYGRGGSPLQNLVVRGHRNTMLSALRMVDELDAGPVYLKEPLSLEGSAEEIYIRASRLSAEMIRKIIQECPAPTPQQGPPVEFRRRCPEQSEIPSTKSLSDLHDFIRMLDADGYPRAFLEHQGFLYEFGRATYHDGHVRADVTITPCQKADA